MSASTKTLLVIHDMARGPFVLTFESKEQAVKHIWNCIDEDYGGDDWQEAVADGYADGIKSITMHAA